MLRTSTPDEPRAGIDNYMKVDGVQVTKKLRCSIHIEDAPSEDEHKDSNKTLGSGTKAASGSTAFGQKVR